MRERDDEGFTLIEVVIVTILLGLISLVIGFAITTVLRVTPTADSQVDNARSLQGLTAWFQSDAASAVASGTNVRRNPSSLDCPGSETAPGVNLVEFRWTVFEPAQTTFISAYRLENDGLDRTVRRYQCSGSGPPYSGTSAQNLTGALTDAYTVTTTPTFDRVSLDLQGADGSPIRIEATPRNPSASLPSTTVPATVPPPQPCVITFLAPLYGPRARATSGPEIDKLEFGITLAMDIAGDTCGRIEVTYDTGVEIKTREVTWSGTFGYVTLPKGDGTVDTPTWTADDHVIGVYNNCTPPTCTDPPLHTTILRVT